MISEMGNSTVFAAISNRANGKFKKNYRKKLKVTHIPFRRMEKIPKNGRSECETGRKEAGIK